MSNTTRISGRWTENINIEDLAKIQICANCQQKLNLKAVRVNGIGLTHGICARHALQSYLEAGISEERAKAIIQKQLASVANPTSDLQDPKNADLLKQFINAGFLVKHTGEPLPTSGVFSMKETQDYSTLNVPKSPSDLEADTTPNPKNDKLGDWVICSGCVQQFKMDQSKFSKQLSYGYCPRHLYERFIRWAKMKPIDAQNATIKVLKSARAEGKQIPIDFGSHPDVIKKYQSG